MTRPRDLILPDGDGETHATSWEQGRSSGVVLVHGIVGHRSMPEIRAVADALASDHDVLAIDVRGHGDDRRRFSWGCDEWRQVDAATQFLAAGGRRVAAVGFSFGGYHVAMAASRGAALDRVVLVGAPVDLRIFDRHPVVRPFLRHVPHLVRRRRRFPRLGPLPRLAATRIDDADLAAIRAAPLVIHCGGDWLISRRHAATYAGAIPGSVLEEIPGGLHAEYLLAADPFPLLDRLRKFLADGGC